MKWLFFVLAAAVALYGLHRLALWAESRGWIYYKHKQASTSTLGNAFLEVQAIVDPGKRHVLEATREEVELEDESGEPPPADHVAVREEPAKLHKGKTP